MKFDVFMWLLAVVWVAFPEGWNAGFVITAVFIALSVASGAKLHAVSINMALRAPEDPAAAAAAADVRVAVQSGGAPGGTQVCASSLSPPPRAFCQTHACYLCAQ